MTVKWLCLASSSTDWPSTCSNKTITREPQIKAQTSNISEFKRHFQPYPSAPKEDNLRSIRNLGRWGKKVWFERWEKESTVIYSHAKNLEVALHSTCLADSTFVQTWRFKGFWLFCACEPGIRSRTYQVLPGIRIVSRQISYAWALEGLTQDYEDLLASGKEPHYASERFLKREY